jgi:hypothetical protein
LTAKGRAPPWGTGASVERAVVVARRGHCAPVAAAAERIARVGISAVSGGHIAVVQITDAGLLVGSCDESCSIALALVGLTAVTSRETL